MAKVSQNDKIQVVFGNRVYSIIAPGTGAIRGMSHFALAVSGEGNPVFTFVPSVRTMRRLARTFLDGSKYEELEHNRTGSCFFSFYVEPGIRKENRVAFLAAVVANGLK